MVRLVSSIVLTVAIVIFAMTNTHRVNLNMFVGPPIQIRIIFLILTAFLMGMAFNAFIIMIWRLKLNQHTRKAPPHDGDMMEE